MTRPDRSSKNFADEAVERLLAGTARHDDAYSILQALFEGHPTTAVSRLTQSSEPAAISAGAWLMSELGDKAADLRDEFAGLLVNTQPAVRIFGLDSVIVNAAACDGDTIATAIALVDDPDDVVRRHAIRLLAVARDEDLRRGAKQLLDTNIRALAQWITDSGPDERSAEAIEDRLKSSDPRVRRFAAAMALRLAPSTVLPLRRAAASQDEEIKGFAEFELGLLGDKEVIRLQP